GHFAGNERSKRLSAVNADGQVFGYEVGISPVSLGPPAILVQGARQCSLIEGDACDNGDLPLAAEGKKLVLWVLVEDVVDNLDCIDQPGPDRLKHVGRLPPVNANPDSPDQSLSLEVIHCTLPPFVTGPRIFPDVELLQVDRGDAQVL